MSSRVSPRHAAWVVREEIPRQRRVRRWIWTSVIAVAALIFTGTIGWGIYAMLRPDYTAPPGATKDGSGVVLGNGPVRMDVYVDFICPACRQFEARTGAALDRLVADGRVQIVYHPVAYLDPSSTTKYSTRTSAASGCAAEGGKFREYAKALFERQPPQGGRGLGDGELISIGTTVGLDEDRFGVCVRHGKYKAWTRHVSTEAAARGVTGTPAIYVGGQPVQLTTQAITAAVAAAGK
jgi:protein-disulfide isomerase